MTAETGKSLYNPEFERDSCGFGLIANQDDIASHWVVETAIAALARLTHRGAVAADGKTGDGCGLLLKFPERFFREIGVALGYSLNKRFCVGTVFLSQNDVQAKQARDAIVSSVSETGLEVVGWRVVPIDESVCGEHALATLPR